MDEGVDYTQLPLDTAFDTTAVLSYVRDGVTYRFAWGDFTAPLYGAIYAHEAVVPQSFTAGVPLRLTGFDAAFVVTPNVVPSHGDDELVVNRLGLCEALFQLSLSSSVANVVIDAHVRVDNVEQPFAFHRKISSGGDLGSGMAISPVIIATLGEAISIWLETDKNTDLTLDSGQLRVGNG